MMHNPIRHNKDAEGTLPENQPDRIPGPDSFPSPEPAPAAVSFEAETRQQLNFLRDRTFNPELRKLVDRIRVNEPSSGQTEIAADANIDEVTDEELHLYLYRLFYKARNVHDNLEMNISFDPFKEIDNSSTADIKGSIARHFTGMMRHLSFSPFALLSYDMTAKGYIPKIHDLEGFDLDNIVISLNDGLFQKILTARDGILIDPIAIREDTYLGKIFSMPDDGESRSLYFIMLNNIVDEMVKELSDDGATSFASFLPSALLMIVIQEGGVAADPGDIARMARERLLCLFSC